MTDSEARSEALRLAASGATNATITEHLSTRGYVSAKTGKPLTTNGVAAMLIKAGHRRYKKRTRASRKAATPKAEASSPKRKKDAAPTSVDKIIAIKSILNVSSMPATERIKLALLMIG